MTKQLVLPGMEEALAIPLAETPTRFLAIYFSLGRYTEDDRAPELVNYDCPFDDSPAFEADSKDALVAMITDLYNGGDQRNYSHARPIGMDFESVMPDIIVDGNGKILDELYDSLAIDLEVEGARHPKRKPLSETLYSLGRESLADLWERESHRWVS